MKQFLQSSQARLYALMVVAGCALWGFGAMFNRLRGVFSDHLEDMSHGWLVLPFSLYVLWTDRARLKAEAQAGAPSLWGLLACLPCVAVALLGTRGLQVRFEQVGFIGLCIAVPWAFFGARLARRVVFPALFLCFTIPLATFLDVVTIHLRLLASGTAFAVLRGFGVDVVQQGTAILSQGAHPFSIDVAEPCSGLRSLFALMALTAAYSWYTQPTWLRRGALFACAVPLAVAGNVVRILTICLCAAWGSADFATGFYHDYSGYVVFIVAISLMVACGEVVARCAESLAAGRKGGPAPAAAPADVPAAARRGVAVPLLAVAVLCPLFAFQALTPDAELMEPPVFSLPGELPGTTSEEVRYCQAESCARMFPVSKMERMDACPFCGGSVKGCSLGESTVLPADTEIRKRLYHGPLGRDFLVSAVVGGRSKSSLHRPELCMPAQGFRMEAPCDLFAGGRAFHALRLSSAHAPSTTLAYTYFNQAGVRTASHTHRILLDTWDRSVLNRIDRWVMVTVAAHGPGGVDLDRAVDRAAVTAFLSSLSEKLP